MTPITLTPELNAEIVRTVGLSDDRVLFAASTEHPDCLCMVVLGDVAPENMQKLCDVLRKASNCEWRLCANVIEEADVWRFLGLPFESAWRLSWERNVATVRMG